MLYDEDIVNDIKDLLADRKETLSVAESVTAGHLQAAFSSALEATKFFQGGITAYNAGQKKTFKYRTDSSFGRRFVLQKKWLAKWQYNQTRCLLVITQLQ